MKTGMTHREEILIRLESVKAAAKVCSDSEGIGNLLIHARWLAEFIISGEPPTISRSGAETGS
jgi:hypothetical protein